MQHLTEINRAYLARFAALETKTQSDILETIDDGGEVLSVYKLESGKTVCSIVPVESARIPLWEYVVAESEAEVLGHAVEDALNLLPLDFKHEITAKLSDGWALQVIVRHDGPGAMLVNIVRNNYAVEVARLKTEPTLQ